MSPPKDGAVSIFVCSGPTGGHFYPALAFAQTLRAKHPEAEVFFVLSKLPDFMKHALTENDFQYQSLVFSAPRLKRLFHAGLAAHSWFRAFFRSLILLRSRRPRLVVSFGSFAVIPTVLAASLLQIPIFVHEQNVIPGKANRFLSPWASRIAVSFAETRRWFPGEKAVYSGFPLRAEFRSNGEEKKSKADGDCFEILVLGGSQGAARINAVFPEALQLLSAEERAHVAVNHIVGAEGWQRLERVYRSLGVRTFEVYGFTDRIAEKMKQADLVISRAGAGTIFELAQLSRPSILIPYPHASGHQEVNAEYLALRGAVRVIREDELSASRLVSEIRALQSAEKIRAELGSVLNSFVKKEACEIMAQSAWSLL